MHLNMQPLACIYSRIQSDRMFPILRGLSIIVAVLAIATAGCTSREDNANGPLVLAAASLQEALEASADAWEVRGHARPILSFAATSALARQIESGAEGDLFVSADEAWMDQLEAGGHLAPGTRKVLAGNRLALIAPAGAKADIAIAPGVSLAPLLGSSRLAMAEPDAVPAGRYAREALVTLGMWDAVSDRLAIGENVRVALALVSRGEAPLAIVYATDARAHDGVRIVGLFPENSHTPIAYPLARLASASHKDTDGFARFLLSPEGQAILRDYGFEPGDAP